jgi:hypothetical protein
MDRSYQDSTLFMGSARGWIAVLKPVTPQRMAFESQEQSIDRECGR